MDCFLPQAKTPSQKVLSGRIIPNLVQKAWGRVRNVIRGRSVTLQADGWTGINHRHVIAFMVGVDGKVYTVNVIDATNERKTADQFLEQLDAAYHKAETDMGVMVICVTTDASGEAAKARRLFKLRYPHIIVLDCYAHQVSCSDSSLITWLRSKTLLLGLICSAYAQHNNGKTKSILRAVLTRWTSHYLAFNRLLELQQTLDLVVLQDAMKPADQKLIVIGDAAAKNWAKKMIEIIKDSSFWLGLVRVVRHLCPLAIATNMLQSVSCRLDTVLITFGFLYMQFTKMKQELGATDEDIAACERVINSIEKCWAKADQAIFIAAVILNPFYPFTIFQGANFLSMAGTIKLFQDLWTRFFREDPPTELDLEVMDFISGTGVYQQLAMMVNLEEAAAIKQGWDVNPINVFDLLKLIGTPDTPLVRLSRHLYAVSTNSASCERLFSSFGNLLTKLRNRLGLGIMQSIAELKLRINDENRNNTQAQQRLKRHLGHKVPQAQNLLVSVSSTGTSVPSGTSPENLTSPYPTSTPPSIGDPISNDYTAWVQAQTRLIDEEEAEDCGRTNVNEIRRRDLSLADVTFGSYPLCMLFNYSESTWMQKYENTGAKTFDQELEVYEMVDLQDAEGVEDVEGVQLDLDASAESSVLAMLSHTR
ncbi:hypothetical protein FA15DRAFT_592446 [Coprinopsis marcescibilis]|uniref:DUF659 domain-containing protein n=1 Tax=Coprinopsis marcescibilis TaxID=230819 RepID=A0A5C3KVR2_COPMA|nr:hypothetical protein FA15DRAFT_592446 [Coprinopsis marcescibilis]